MLYFRQQHIPAVRWALLPAIDYFRDSLLARAHILGAQMIAITSGLKPFANVRAVWPEMRHMILFGHVLGARRRCRCRLWIDGKWLEAFPCTVFVNQPKRVIDIDLGLVIDLLRNWLRARLEVRREIIPDTTKAGRI